MAETSALKPLFKDIADAIREKEESTDLIPAEEFSERIRAIDTMPEGLCAIMVETENQELGVVSGGGFASNGMSITVSAIPTLGGYSFKQWEEDGNVVSQNQNYSFIVEGNRNLKAMFFRSGFLPVGYTEIEYINTEKHKGGFTILKDKNISFDTAVFKIRAELIELPLTLSDSRYYTFYLFTSDTSVNANCTSSKFANGSTTSYLFFGKSSTAMVTNAGNEIQDIIVDFSTGKFIFCGNSFDIGNKKVELPASFSVGGSYAGANTAISKLYAVTVEENGEITHEFRPCTSPEKTVGLFDILNGEFFVGFGDGWEAGPEV